MVDMIVAKCCLQHYYIYYITIPVFRAFLETLVEMVSNYKHVFIIGLRYAHFGQFMLHFFARVWNMLSCYGTPCMQCIVELWNLFRKKFLCFQTEHRYPERNIEQSDLLNQFGFQSLQYRRLCVSVKDFF